MKGDSLHQLKAAHNKKIYDPSKDDPTKAFRSVMNDLEVYLCSLKLDSSKAVKTMQYAKKRLEAQIIQNCEQMGSLVEVVASTCRNLDIDVDKESSQMDKVDVVLPKLLR